MDIADPTPEFKWTHSGDLNPPIEFTLRVTSGDINTGPYSIVGVFTVNTGAFTQTSFTPGTPLKVGPGGTGDYTWRVTAKDGALNTADSVVETFTIDLRIPVIQLLSPIGIFTGDIRPLQWKTTGDIPPEFAAEIASATYDVQIGSPDFNSSIFGQFDIPHSGVALAVQSLSPSGTPFPLPDGVYEWSVRGKNADVVPTFSAFATFIVDLNPPAAPSLLAPAPNARISNNTPTFDWSIVTDTSGITYRIQVDDDSGFNSPEIDESGLATSIFSVGVTRPSPTILADGTYFWQVQALDGANRVSSFSSTFIVTIDTTPPGKPPLVSPVDNARLSDNTPLFDWDDAPITGDLLDYRLQVTTGSFSAGPFAIDVFVSGPTQFQAIAQLADAVYQWRVIARDIATPRNVSTSNVRTVTVDTTPPGAPNLVAPLNNAFLNDNTPLFQWSKPTDAIGYRVLVTSGDINAGPFDIDVIVADPTIQFQSITGLADADYQWRVIARDAALPPNTASSASRAFRIDTQIVSPGLLAPLQGEITGDQRPTFVWNHTDISSPVTYKLVVTSDVVSGSFSITTPNLFFSTTGDLPLGPGSTGDYFWRVIATDPAGNTAASVVRKFTVNINVPGAPVLVSPITETSERNTTFTWVGEPLAGSYKIEIILVPGNFTTPDLVVNFPSIPHSGGPTDIQSHTLSPQLTTGQWYQWRVKGQTPTFLEGIFSSTADFIITGAKVNVTISVFLQGTGALPADFKVDLYDATAFRGAEVKDKPWLLFTGDRANLLTRTIAFKGITGTADVANNRTQFTLVLPDVVTGFFDITIQANQTLVNLRDDVGVHVGLTSPVDMGTLLAGNAIDDPRPGVELASIINALDASLIASVLLEKQTNPTVYDARVDFDRDGQVTLADFDLLQANYLKFSPLLVVNP